MSTRLTAAIMVDSLEQGLADAARAAEFGADLVEFRIDRFTDSADAVAQLVQRSPLPCILTCRPTWEGGEYAGDDATRLAILEQVLTSAHPPTYIDVELLAWQKSAELRDRLQPLVQGDQAATGLILSSHDFERRPADLYKKIQAMADEPACRVIKVAWFARSLRDNLEAFEILASQYKPAIALCMGEFGLPSRVLAKKFNALLTFAAIDDTSGTAPGQPTLTEIKQLYRWDHLTPSTQVFGVIGFPVGHSLSPRLHNAGFDAINYDGVYLPMPIPPEYEHFKATVGTWLDFSPLHFRGASVTIPHKENLLRFVAESGGKIEQLSQTIGAANTLIRTGDGAADIEAINTDYAGALDAVCDGLGISREQLKGKRVAVIGAGGAARALVAGFAGYGSTVVIYNRTIERAQAIAQQFDGKVGKVVAAPLEKLADTCCEVFINCTPMGMHPKVNATPLPGDQPPACWGPGTVVFDTIYNPAQTKLLKLAKQAGCVTIAGKEMFIRQGAAQFERWTGQAAPRKAMAAAMVDG